MIKLFVMDVDGTLTDGGIYYDNNGNEFKKFSVKDGAGIKLLHDIGIETMILTGRISECVKKRVEELKINYLIQGVSNKAEYLKKFIEDNHLNEEEIAYIGDDINDLECLELVGNSACPCDASPKVKKVVNIICKNPGGQGAIREFVDYIFDEFLYLEALTDEKEAWYTKTHIRAHAGGSIDGFMYTNSKEALEASYNKGIRVIEVDLTITADEKAVLSHNFIPELTPEFTNRLPRLDEFLHSRICGKFTPMSLEDLIIFMENHKDVYMVIDHPAKGFKQLTKIVNCLLNIHRDKNFSKDIFDRMIFQVFTIQEHQFMKSIGLFHNLEFYFSAKRDIKGTLEYIVRNCVHTVSINQVKLNKTIISKFNQLGVKVFSPSINEKSKIIEVFSMGVWGVTSDFLNQEELSKILGDYINE